ncbi:hypothetical protein MKS88_004114 [Plasmodium brasilianum]|uniref:Uncharacterized protein n=1 Tax=Plasmodium brasilianum TaxID=5824 RepID=A0ACB9Y5L2_PLABR|nr:hypothetical protein MKS88_004114 [Plasmodium brasilianum]
MLHLTKKKKKIFLLKKELAYCEGRDLLLAPNSEKIFNISKVLDICESKKRCDFVSYSPKRILRNSIFYEHEKELKHTGANWVCSGDKWVLSRPKKYWITAVKEDHIKENLKNYKLISLNISGECDREHVLMKISKFISPKGVAEECNKIPNCKFIVFNYNRQLGGEKKADDMAILCSQPPINRKNKLGFLIVGKNYIEVPYGKRKTDDRKKKIISAKGGTVGGSITPDDNYYNYKKGEIVHASKIN